VASEVDEHVEAALAAFSRAYCRRLSSDGSEGISDEDLQAEVRSAFRFADARGRKPVAVRALNPTRERDGYEPLGSVVETNSDDWPFLVDSATAALEQRGEQIARVVHPIMGVRRDPEGHIVEVRGARDAAHRESIMHFDLGRRLDDEELAEVERAVRAALLAVRASVTDFAAMTQRVEGMIGTARRAATRYDPDEVREAVDFLAWLLRGNFVLLGVRE
jgi:glutamate dehydrogenase